MTAPAIGRVLGWIGGLGIIIIAVARCGIAFTPMIVFDFDPLLDPEPFAGLGPAGSLWLDGALLLFAALALLGETLCGQRIDWKLCLPALIPAPMILWHGWSDAGDLWRGSTWLASAVAAATIAHLARHERRRIILVAIMLAVAAPLVVRAATQVFHEHALMVAEYERHKAQFLGDRGWEDGSPQVLIWERRLHQPQPTGWFITTNVFGALMATTMVAWLGLAIAAMRARLPSGHAGVALIAAGASAWGLWMTGSKGAILAAAAGLAMLLPPLVWPRIAAEARRVAPRLGFIVIVLALGAVAMRGLLLPEGFAGEKSLLFRWHYVVGAVRIISEHGLAGVGPDGFQQAYLGARLPRSPEEVASAHAMFFDWLAMVGIAGAAWIVLALVMPWRAGREARIARETDARPAISDRALVGCAAAAGFIALGGALWCEVHGLERLLILSRALGVAAFIALAAVGGLILARIDRWMTQWTLLIAATVLLMHSQIEMNYFQPGSVAWCFVLLALAGPMSTSRDRTAGAAAQSFGGFALAGASAILAGWIIVTAAMPMHRQESMMIEAAAKVAAAEGLDRAAQSLARSAAAAQLQQAFEVGASRDPSVLEASARQLAIAAEAGDSSERSVHLAHASALADDAVARFDRGSSHAMAAGLHARLAELTGDPQAWNAAIAHAQRLTEIDPHGPGAWRRLGDLRWSGGDRAGAAAAYHRSLLADAQFELDPLKQMSPRERQRLESRIGEAEASPDLNPP